MSELQVLLRHLSHVISHDTQGLASNARTITRILLAAWAMLVIGGLLVAFAIVYACVALLPTVPAWALFGAVGVAVLLVGGGLQFQARRKLDSFRPLQKHTADLANDATRVVGQIDDAIASSKVAFNKTTESLHVALQDVKNATDFHYQVEHHPWAMFAGAASLGFVGGVLINGAKRAQAAPMPTPQGMGVYNAKKPIENASNGKAILPEAPQGEPGVFEKLGDMLAPQATLLREIAIGTVFALARDLARDAVAKPFVQPIEDFFNDATKKFGGRPVPPGQFKAATVNPAPASNAN